MLNWLKTVVETMFRFFPFPTRTGLRVIGQPGPEAPVFVTCNFDLTVRRVLRELAGLDCYLLVVNSKGINVWCASGGGILNAHSLVSVLKTSRIAERVSHRRLILPQLSAPGIDVALVEAETGWHCKFGPVYAEDIPAYVAANFQKTDELRRARFPLPARLEMAVMWAAPMSLLVGIPVAIISLRSLPGVLALIWAFTLCLYAFYEPVNRFVPGAVGMVKTLVLALLGVGGVVTYSLVIGHWSLASVTNWSMGILGVALVLGFDLEGTSPLQAGATVSYWVARWPGVLKLWARIGYDLEMPFTLQVDPELCKGCKTCVEVCPKGVFELYRLDGKQKSRVAHMIDCEQCTACVKQCPERAIMAEPPIKGFAEWEDQPGSYAAPGVD
jgi:NAD-dependent dihydropyrimidine dehydrogenase PreA subunit